MAGLLAANILRKNNPIILERQNGLPENHSALLRHKTNKISLATSIPFEKVSISKSIFANGKLINESNPYYNNLYSKKVSGLYSERSIKDLNVGERYISPKNFIDKMADGCKIKFGYNLVNLDQIKKINSDPIISTIPIEVLCKIIGREDLISDIDFSHSAIKTAKVKIDNANLYQTIYYPEKKYLPYRISITGDIAIYECMDGDFSDATIKSDFIVRLEDQFGIDCSNYLKNTFSFNSMKYGKINKVKNKEKLKEAIGAITKEFNIYSLGRFATWRNLLLDDIVEDVEVIQKLINSNGYYTGK